MSWKLKGTWYESCSCKMSCRCALGPAEPDQGWCSGFQLIEVERGESDGVNLDGARFALHMQLPGDFFSGIEKGRMYLDESLSDKQREEIEGIYQGRRGGFWEGINGMIAEWLPSKLAKISINAGGDSITASIGEFGEMSLALMKTEAGAQTELRNAPVVAGFQVSTVELATANGTKLTDPDMRQWESLGFGGRVPFDWSS